jgi:hypothetical protein
MPKGGEDRWFNTRHAVVDADPEHSEADYDGYYMDWSDAKALVDQMYIDFYDTQTHNSIAFKAFITDYSETYEAQYTNVGEDTKNVDFDPKNYKRVIRRINLSWKTVAASFLEAKENMQRCSEFIKMGYGNRDSMSRTSMGSHQKNSQKADKKNLVEGSKKNKRTKGINHKGMEVRVRFSNWLVNPHTVDTNNPGAFAPADDTGLRCLMDNIQFSPDMDAGSFDTNEGVFPKVINLSCALVPNQSFGYGNKFDAFPFGYKGLVTHNKGAPPTFKDKSDDDVDAAIEDQLLNW